MKTINVLSIICILGLLCLVAYLQYSILTNKPTYIVESVSDTVRTKEEMHFHITPDNTPKLGNVAYNIHTGQTEDITKLLSQLLEGFEGTEKEKLELVKTELAKNGSLLPVSLDTVLTHKEDTFEVKGEYFGKINSLSITAKVNKATINPPKIVTLKEVMLGGSVLMGNNLTGIQGNLAYKWKDNLVMTGIGVQKYNTEYTPFINVTYVKTIKPNK